MSLNWLFEIGTIGSPTYRLALKDETYGGNVYSGVVDSKTFRGASLNRIKYEIDHIPQSKLVFKIIDNAGIYTASSLAGLDVILRFIKNGVEVESWRFQVEPSTKAYKILTINCIDFLSTLLSGVWPDTDLIRNLYPEALLADIDEKACVPVVFGGNSYIPLQSIASSGDVYYILGLASGCVYDIEEVTSPHAIDGQEAYTPGVDITCTQSTVGTVRVFQATIDGETNSNWRQGPNRVPPLVKFKETNSYETLTNPVDILKFIIKEWGAVDGDFDATWGTVATAVASRGVVFSRGYWKHEEKKKILLNLMAISDVNIIFGEKITIALNSKTSIINITSNDLRKSNIEDVGSFIHSRTIPNSNDSAYISYTPVGKPQDKIVKAKVTADATVANSATVNPADDTLNVVGVANDQHAQKIGTLYFQKKLYKNGEVRFLGSPSLITLLPGQVITIYDALYGETTPAIIDSMVINRDSTIQFTCFTYGVSLYDFGDFTPSTITDTTDTTTTGFISTLEKAKGATWNLDIDSQPADALLLNELNGIGGYQQAYPPYVNKPCTIDCYVNNASSTAGWFLVAQFILDGSDESCSFNGLFHYGAEDAAFTRQMRVSTYLTTGTTAGVLTLGRYLYSGDVLYNKLQVRYSGSIVQFFANLAANESCLFDGAWVGNCTQTQTYIHSEQSSSDSTGTSDPGGSTLTVGANYVQGADITSSNTANNANNYTGNQINESYTQADINPANLYALDSTADSKLDVVNSWRHPTYTTEINGTEIRTGTITVDRLNAASGTVTFTGVEMVFANAANLILQSTDDTTSILQMTRGSYAWNAYLTGSGSNFVLGSTSYGTTNITIGNAYTEYVISSANTVASLFAGSSSSHADVNCYGSSQKVEINVGTTSSTSYNFTTSAFYADTSGKNCGQSSDPWSCVFGTRIIAGGAAPATATAIRSESPGTGSTDYALLCEEPTNGGDLFSVRGNGDIYTGGTLWYSSAESLKRDIKVIDEPVIGKLLKAIAKRFKMKSEGDEAKETAGFTVENIETLIPEATTQLEHFDGLDENGEQKYKKTGAMRSEPIIAYAVKGIQEHQAYIDSLSSRSEDLEVRLFAYEALMERVAELENKLKQNI